MALKLLLADESITIRKVVTKVFSNTDYEVATVQEHDDILETVKQFNPDVVLLSTSLAGDELPRQIAEITKHSSKPNSVILMGNRGNKIDANNSLDIGAGGFVYKPLDNRELQKVIDSILHEPEVKPKAASKATKLPATAGSEDIDKRAKILFDLFESYFNENMVILTDSMTKALVPKVATEISSRIIESLEITELPKQIMGMTRGIVNDLVPQIAERVISREVELIKEEAIRLIEAEDDESE